MPSAGEDLHGKLEKQREKNAKKLKKILSPEQYDRWADYRLRHPERKDKGIVNLYNTWKIPCKISGYLVKCTHGVLEEKKTVWESA